MQNEQIRIPLLYRTMEFWAGEWGEASPKEKQRVSRAYYVWVFAESDIQTDLMTEDLWNGVVDENDNKIKASPDHFTIPQFCGYMILDNPEVFLKDEDIFWEMFNWNRFIIKTTSTQNTALSKYSWGKNNLVKCSLYERYAKEKITLALKAYGILEDQTDCFPKPPEGFLEMEKKYIVEA